MKTHRLLPLLLVLLLPLACADQETDVDGLTADTMMTDTDTAMADEGTTAMGGARVAVTQQEPYGQFLVDGQGMALYLFTADEQGQSSSCYDACAEAWPPFTATGQPAVAGPPVQENLLDTIERRDGRMQVTYDGWPLYYYAEDGQAGDVSGQDVQGFGGEWYLVSPEGEEVHAEGEAQ